MIRAFPRCGVVFSVAVVLAAIACSSSPVEGVASPDAASPSSTADGDAAPRVDGSSTPGADSGAEAPDAAQADTNDAGAPDPGIDGTPTRVACTSKFGNGLAADHGRLDGYLISIVPATTHSCNGDSSHIHLQVKLSGAVYDVAVNVDGFETGESAALPGPPWSEGFHPNEDLDYATDLGLHTENFTLTGLAAVRQQVETALANANHVAIYATGYGPTGAHLVHRQGSGRDGAIFLDPLGPHPYVLAFRFSTSASF